MYKLQRKNGIWQVVDKSRQKVFFESTEFSIALIWINDKMGGKL